MTAGAGGSLIHVATRCATIQEFIEKFAVFASEGALVLPASGELPVGTEGRFVILLRDRSAAMRGRCRVTDARPAPTSANGQPVRRTMLRVALLEMDEATQAVHRMLLAHQSPEPVVASGTPPPRPVVPPPVSARAVVPPPVTPRPPAPPASPSGPVTRSGSRPPAPAAANGPATQSGMAPALPSSAGPITQSGPRPAPPPPPPGPITRSAPRPTPPPGPAAAPLTQSGVHRAAPAAGAPVTRSGPRPAAPVAPRAPTPSAPIDAIRAEATAPLVSRAAPVAKTMIGVPSAQGAESSAPKARPSSPSVPIVAAGSESRAPGASFTLPANPLSELGPEDLATFIDCTLFESETVEADLKDDGGPTREIDPASASTPVRLPSVAASPTPTSMPQAPAAHPTRAKAPPTVRLETIARHGTLYAAFAVAGLLLGRFLPVPSSGHPPAGAARAVAVAEAAQPVPPVPEAPAAAAEAPAAAAEAPAAAGEAPAPAPEATAPRAHTATPAAEPAHDVAPAPAAAAPAPAEAKLPRPTVEPLGNGARCTVHVETEPAEVKVFWGDTLLGTTPMADAEVACATANVTFKRDRYQPVTKEVSPSTDGVTQVSQKLHRPPATLIVGSSPPNAAITVNGQPQGASPKRIPVFRYESVSIQVSLPGYAPWKKEVYMRQAETRIGMQLVPTARADAGKRSASH